MRSYFWANLTGVVINWEVLRLRLYRNMRPMDILWELALQEGTVDQMLLVVPVRSPHLGDLTTAWKKGDALQDRPKYPEAFLSVMGGRHLKCAKFRLKGISFHLFDGIRDPYIAPGEGGSEDQTTRNERCSILIDVDKVEQTLAVQSGN